MESSGACMKLPKLRLTFPHIRCVFGHNLERLGYGSRASYKCRRCGAEKMGDLTEFLTFMLMYGASTAVAIVIVVMI